MEPLSPAFARLTNLQTRLREIPHFFETAVRVMPPTRSRTIAARSMFIGARPIRTPSSFALRMPAKTLSRIKSDSSSAIEPMSVKNSLPIGPLVSTFSRREMKTTPRLSNSSMTCKKCACGSHAPPRGPTKPAAADTRSAASPAPTPPAAFVMVHRSACSGSDSSIPPSSSSRTHAAR
jgi:hypothetical protein